MLHFESTTIWSAVASEARHRFGIGGPVPAHSKRWQLQDAPRRLRSRFIV
jgi:hypothetical protein